MSNNLATRDLRADKPSSYTEGKMMKQCRVCLHGSADYVIIPRVFQGDPLDLIARKELDGEGEVCRCCVDITIELRSQKHDGSMVSTLENCLAGEGSISNKQRKRAQRATEHLKIVKKAATFIRECRYRMSYGNNISLEFVKNAAALSNGDFIEVIESRRTALRALYASTLEEIEFHMEEVLRHCTNFEQLFEGEIILAEEVES